MGIGKCQVALPCPTRIRDNWGPVPGLVDNWLWTGGAGDPGVAAGTSAPCSTLRSSHPGGYIRNRSRALLLMSPPPKLGMVLRPSCARMHPQMKRLEWERGPAMMLNPGRPTGRPPSHTTEDQCLMGWAGQAPWGWSRSRSVAFPPPTPPPAQHSTAQYKTIKPQQTAAQHTPQHSTA